MTAINLQSQEMMGWGLISLIPGGKIVTRAATKLIKGDVKGAAISAVTPTLPGGVDVKIGAGGIRLSPFWGSRTSREGISTGPGYLNRQIGQLKAAESIKRLNKVYPMFKRAPFAPGLSIYKTEFPKLKKQFEEYLKTARTEKEKSAYRSHIQKINRAADIMGGKFKLEMQIRTGRIRPAALSLDPNQLAKAVDELGMEQSRMSALMPHEVKSTSGYIAGMRELEGLRKQLGMRGAAILSMTPPSNVEDGSAPLEPQKKKGTGFLIPAVAAGVGVLLLAKG